MPSPAQLVIFESGVHDFASPDRRVHRQMLDLCVPPQPPCTDAQLMPVLKNQSWRLDLSASYRKHLEQLMGMWGRCAKVRSRAHGRPPFRPIFKLNYVPNSRTELGSCSAEWGYNTMGHCARTAASFNASRFDRAPRGTVHTALETIRLMQPLRERGTAAAHMPPSARPNSRVPTPRSHLTLACSPVARAADLLAGNAIAREVVEAHGFEVFDPTAALMHASPSWYDLAGKDALHSDVLSDTVTQMLINQICEDP